MRIAEKPFYPFFWYCPETCLLAHPNVFLWMNPLVTISMDGYTNSCTPALRSLSSPILPALVIAGIVLLSVLVSACTGTVPARPTGFPVPIITPQNQTGLELVFFHPVPGCDSCEGVGLLANETVNAYFGPERAAGKITFRDVNLNLPENRDIAHRYGAYTESLWIGEYNENGFHATEIVDIWYYAYNHEEYLKYLKGVLDRKLAGTG
jgi:hypothetical protein